MNLTGYTFDVEKGVVIGKRGRPVGRVCNRGYVLVSDGRNTYSAHRMIWQHVHGLIPAGMEINHKNGIKTDNRIENLLICSHQYHVALHHRLEASAAWPEFQPVTRNVKGNRHA